MQKDTPGEKDLSSKLKVVIAHHLGVDPQDVNDEDSFFDDLHMSATELYDLVETLTKKGYEITPEEIANCETVVDLADLIASKEEIQ